MEDREKKAVLEAILFLSGEPIALPALKEVIEIPETELKELMDELIKEYRERKGGLHIVEVAHGYQMVTSPECAEWLKKFKSMQLSTKLSMPALETLAIIAYKQPIIRVEVEQIRGVNSDSAIRTLLEKRLIKVIGRKEGPGRPFLYGTTREFLEYFGLKDITELPTLKRDPELVSGEEAA